MYLSIGQAANLIGVSPSTLRLWERNGHLKPPNRTLGGHRRYDRHCLNSFVKEQPKNCKRKQVAYARVSSSDQFEDLKRQKQVLNEYCKKHCNNFEIISDLGSGMNYKKRGLNKLIKMILLGQVQTIILTHKDRLLRFGNEIIFSLCRFFQTEIILLKEPEKLSDEVRLARDVLEVITVFSSRLYGKRAHQNKGKK